MSLMKKLTLFIGLMALGQRQHGHHVGNLIVPMKLIWLWGAWLLARTYQ